MGQTSTEAKREVDETRAHLNDTIAALQLKARRGLDLRHQLQNNHAFQASLGAVILGIASLAVLWNVRRSRRTPAERLVRKLRLNDLKDRINEFGGDARAWATAQKRIVKANGKAGSVEVKSHEPVARRLLVSALEAALTAMAAGYAKKVIDRAGKPRDFAARAATPVSKGR